MPLDMNPEIRAQWCAALRSGDYQQVKGALRGQTNDGTEGHCCLGVLTDLYIKAGHEFDSWDIGVLALDVQEWAGLRSGNPALIHSGPSDGGAAGLNDAGTTFAQIAGLIDGGAS